MNTLSKTKVHVPLDQVAVFIHMLCLYFVFILDPMVYKYHLCGTCRCLYFMENKVLFLTMICMNAVCIFYRKPGSIKLKMSLKYVMCILFITRPY